MKVVWCEFTHVHTRKRKHVQGLTLFAQYQLVPPTKHAHSSVHAHESAHVHVRSGVHTRRVHAHGTFLCWCLSASALKGSTLHGYQNEPYHDSPKHDLNAQNSPV
jgi:hypothetical protein